MAALQRKFLPPARWPFCFVAYGPFWAVGGPFLFRFPGWAATEASGCKTLASQALEEAAPLFPILMDNRYRLHLL